MTAPGWYNAEGDPPGSQRYWDGAQWVGDPVFEPAPAAAGTMPGAMPLAAPGQPPVEGGYAYVGAPATKQFPTGLKTLGIVLSVLCLLYTSPSPRDATLSRMPSSA